MRATEHGRSKLKKKKLRGRRGWRLAVTEIEIGREDRENGTGCSKRMDGGMQSRLKVEVRYKGYKVTKEMKARVRERGG